jgi:hypothetical protein
VRAEHSEHERGHYITWHDIYRLRKIVEREKATGSILSDQSREERSDESPTEAGADAIVEAEAGAGAEELATHDIDEVERHQGLADEDEGASGANGQPDGYAESDSETPTSSFANTQAYTPATGTTTCVGSIAPWPGPAAQMAPYAVPCAPSPYNGQMTPYVPPPIVVYVPFFPYHMVLYPMHPAYFPSPPC